MNDSEVNIYAKYTNSKFELIIDTYKYRIETSWRWNDPKDKRVLDSHNTEKFIFDSKEELYFKVLDMLWGKAIKVKINNKFNELNTEAEGPYLDITADNSIYKLFFRLNTYNDILKEKKKEGLDFKEYIQKFIKEHKNIDVNIDNFIENHLVKFDFTSEENQNYELDKEVNILFDIFAKCSEGYTVEESKYIGKLDYFEISFSNLKYNYYERPKDIKPLINSNLDKVVFKTKIGYGEATSIEIETISSSSYKNKQQFKECVKDKMYEKVHKLRYNRILRRKDKITTYLDIVSNSLVICMYEISEYEIDRMKKGIERLINNYQEVNGEIEVKKEYESVHNVIEKRCFDTQTTKEGDINFDIDAPVTTMKAKVNIIPLEKQLGILDKTFKNLLGRSLELRKDINGIYYFLEYHPYNTYINGIKSKNPKYIERVDGNILNLKKDEEKYTIQRNAAIDFFRRILKICEFTVNDNETIVTIVPSSKEYQYGKGLACIAEDIAQNNNIDCDFGILIRKNTIQKLSQGGDRHKDVHYNSIEISSASKILGKNIILLDDVTTTGNSLLACKQMLINSGAANVDCMSLAKTINTYSCDNIFVPEFEFAEEIIF